MKKRYISKKKKIFLLCSGSIAFIIASTSIIVSKYEFAIFFGCSVVSSFLIVLLINMIVNKDDILSTSIISFALFPFYGLLYNIFFGDLIARNTRRVLSLFLNEESIRKIPELSYYSAISIFVLLAANILCEKFFFDKTVMRPYSGNLGENNELFMKGRDAFCKVLIKKIDAINEQTRWSEEYYTPLEADVEIRVKGGKIRKKRDNLLKALKASPKNADNFYLLIGDPGSGKSVSLRKLCNDLMTEVHETDKIPIYVNLKGWNKQQEDIKTYILTSFEDSFIDVNDLLARNFVSNHFEDQLRSGRLFFVFDSFDEIPCILAAEDPKLLSSIIEEISNSLYEFVLNCNAGGIVASRLQNNPLNYFKSKATLYIKPFDEQKVEQFYKKIGMPKKERKIFFREQQHLVHLSKIPFYASLIAEFYMDKNSFPNNQSEMFSCFLQNRFSLCLSLSQFKSSSFNEKDIFELASKISNFMYENDFGLEVPLNIIKEHFNYVSDLDLKISSLVSARIFRDIGTNPKITFVHRRFHEYFLVYGHEYNNLFKNIDVYKQTSTVTNIGDALVLYCEIASEEEARSIASYCYNIIKNCNDYSNILHDDCIKSYRALSFLSEAFPRRTQCLSHIIEDLIDYISRLINEKTDLIIIEKFADAIVLYDEKINDILQCLFNMNIKWLNVIAINRCYYLSKCYKGLRSSIYLHINSLSYKEFFVSFNMLKFIFSVSGAFLKIKYYLYITMLDMLLLPILFCFGLLNLLSIGLTPFITYDWKTMVIVGANIVVIGFISMILDMFIVQNKRVLRFRFLSCLFIVAPLLSSDLMGILYSSMIAGLILLPIRVYYLIFTFIVSFAISIIKSVVKFVIRLLREGLHALISLFSGIARILKNLINVIRNLHILIPRLCRIVFDLVLRYKKALKSFAIFPIGIFTIVGFTHLFPVQTESIVTYAENQITSVRSGFASVVSPEPNLAPELEMPPESITVQLSESEASQESTITQTLESLTPQLTAEQSLESETEQMSTLDPEFETESSQNQNSESEALQPTDNNPVNPETKRRIDWDKISDLWHEYVTLSNTLLVVSIFLLGTATIISFRKIVREITQLILYCGDRKRIKESSLTNIYKNKKNHIERTDLQTALKALRSVKGNRKFLTGVLDSKKLLVGVWKEKRPHLKDEIADEMLIDLEKRSLKL